MKKDQELVQILLQWFQDTARDLPWRGLTDPYPVWVSEIMLQQTRVETVRPYFQRWMKRFPTLEALAEASEEEVLRVWAGLGYYQRVRNLHRAAQQILRDRAGQWPQSPEEWEQLPGVGRYTAGAICSIALGLPTAAVDGNTARVLARIYQIQEPIHRASGRAQIQKLAERLIQLAAGLKNRSQEGKAPEEIPPAAEKHSLQKYTAQNPCGAWTQALMELGAQICLPQSPLCRKCPISSYCRAFQTGESEKVPVGRPRPRTETIELLVMIPCRNRHLYLVHRQSGERNAGLWEFPTYKKKQSILSQLKKEWSLKEGRWRRLGILKHSITRFRLHLDVVQVDFRRPWKGPPNGQWIPRSRVPSLPLSAAHRKIFALFEACESKVTAQRPQTSEKQNETGER